MDITYYFPDNESLKNKEIEEVVYSCVKQNNQIIKKKLSSIVKSSFSDTLKNHTFFTLNFLHNSFYKLESQRYFVETHEDNINEIIRDRCSEIKTFVEVKTTSNEYTTISSCFFDNKGLEIYKIDRDFNGKIIEKTIRNSTIKGDYTIVEEKVCDENDKVTKVFVMKTHNASGIIEERLNLYDEINYLSSKYQFKSEKYNINECLKSHLHMYSFYFNRVENNVKTILNIEFDCELEGFLDVSIIKTIEGINEVSRDCKLSIKTFNEVYNSQEKFDIEGFEKEHLMMQPEYCNKKELTFYSQYNEDFVQVLVDIEKRKITKQFESLTFQGNKNKTQYKEYDETGVDYYLLRQEEVIFKEGTETEITKQIIATDESPNFSLRRREKEACYWITEKTIYDL